MIKSNLKKILLFTISVSLLIVVYYVTYGLLNKIETLSNDISILEGKNELQRDYINELNHDVQLLSEKNESLSKENNALQQEIAQWRDLGTFRITYYCSCTECSEAWGNMTASGRRAEVNRTIAVDPKVIPLGTTVRINGQEFIAEDVGGAIKGNRIDIYVNHHSMTAEMGVDYYDVKVKG